MSYNKKYRAAEQNLFVPTGQFIDVVFQGGSYAISLGYTDHAGKIKDGTKPSGQSGRYVEYVTKKNEKGQDVAKRFKFDQSQGRVMTRPSDTDITGKSQYDFLKNHPECEGSPNGNYVDDGNGGKIQTGISFRELNSAKDAEVALKSDKQRIKAEAAALELAEHDEQTLIEIANVIGYFAEADDQMSLKVLEFARKKPGEFLELLSADDRGIRAIVRRGVAEGWFKTRGSLIKWEDTTLGSNEDDAVATLRKNPDMLKPLQDKLGVDFGITIKKPKEKQPEKPVAA